MGSFEGTRKQVMDEIHNRDLRSASLVLADAIERMSNITSNQLEHGVHAFDKPYLDDMLERAKNILHREVIR